MQRDRLIAGRLWAGWASAHGLVVALWMVLPCAPLALAIAGAVVQWHLLRRLLPDAAMWSVRTAGGIVVGSPFLAWAFFDSSNRPAWANALLIALFAAIVGLVQWFPLRARVDRAGWWVASNALGGALFWPVYEVVWRAANALYTEPPIRWLVARHAYATFASGYGGPSVASLATWLCQGALGGLAYGAVTGIALLRFLRATRPPGVRLPAADGHRQGIVRDTQIP